MKQVTRLGTPAVAIDRENQNYSFPPLGLSPTALHVHGCLFRVERSGTPKDIATVGKACRNVGPFDCMLENSSNFQSLPRNEAVVSHQLPLVRRLP